MRLIDADMFEGRYSDISEGNEDPLWVIEKDEIDNAQAIDIEQLRHDIKYGMDGFLITYGDEAITIAHALRIIDKYFGGADESTN